MRRLIGPAIVLALACLLAAGMGGWLASNTDGTATVASSVTAPTSTPRPAVSGNPVSGVAAYEIVDGPALATQVVATVQAAELTTGRSAGLDQTQPPSHPPICVHDASGQRLTSNELVAQVAFALTDVYSSLGLSNPQNGAPPRIATPCPGDPPLLAAGVTRVRSEWIEGGPTPHVQYASGYKLFIYIVPEAVIQQYLSYTDVRGSRRVTQELRMDGHVGVTFSSAYYLSVSEFRASGHLQYVLWSGLGIGFRQGKRVPNPFVPPDAPTPAAIYWTRGGNTTATPIAP
jgi:hypothetical protein